jgi:putative inorganic carbon (HCO3(-)) transporter
VGFFALLAYFLFVFIRPQEFLGPFIGLPLVKISLIVAAMYMLMEKNRRFDAPQNVFLFLLVLVILMSGITNGWFGGGVDSASFYISTILLPFLVIQNAIDTQKKQRVVMLLLILCALIMVHQGMSQKASETGFGWSGAGLSQKTRITYLGTFNDPNDLGMLFVMVLPFTFYFFKRAKKYLKPLFLGSAGLILYGIYLTNSRGALLGAMSLLIFWFYLKYGLKKSLVIGALASPLAYLIMSMFRTIDSEESSAEGRLDAWYEGFQMFFYKPFFGVGMGLFTEHHRLTAHNSFVLVFSELGFSGYFLWIGFLTATGFMLLMMCKTNFKYSLVNKIDSQESQIAKTLAFSMLGYLVTSFFLSRAYIPILYIFCAMIVGTYYRAIYSDSRKKEVPCRYKYFSKYIWLVSFCSISLIYIVVRLFL